MTPPEWLPTPASARAKPTPKAVGATPASKRGVRVSHLGAFAIAVAVVAFLAGLFGGRRHAMRELRATGPGWNFPSRLYSADLPLGPGDETPPEVLVRQLEARGYHRVADSPVRPGEYRVGESAFEIGLRGFLAAPDPNGFGGP